MESGFAAMDSDVECLERFVTENDDLLKIEELIGRLNVFDALGIARKEIHHSYFLSWLLTPEASHGQGDLFLSAFILDLFKKARAAGFVPPASAIDIDGTELTRIEVRREWRRIDLLLISESPPFLIIIENKVDSGEHSDQLSRYEAIIKRDFSSVPSLYVFLTPTGEEASRDNWMPYSYGDLYRVLDRIQRSTSGSLGSDVQVFLMHYLNLLRSRFMDNPEIAALCRKIYANHRRAIDLILEHRPSAQGEVLGGARTWLANRPTDWALVGEMKNYVFFVPRSWIGKTCDETGIPLEPSACELKLEVECWEGDSPGLAVRLVVGPGKDQTRRSSVIDRLTKSDLDFKMQRKKASGTWTRLESKTLLRWEADQPPGEEAVQNELERYLTTIRPRLDRVPALLAQL